VFDIADMSSGRADPRVTKLSLWQTGNSRSLKAANSRGAYQVGVVYESTGAGYTPYIFDKVADGPLNVIASPTALTVSPGQVSDSDSTNGLLTMDLPGNSPTPNYQGFFYVIDRYGAGDLHRVRVSFAAMTINQDANRKPVSVSLLNRGSSDVFGCDSNHECELPAMALARPGADGFGSGAIYATYARHDVRYAQCPSSVSCSTGVCIGSTCQTTVYPPGIFYTRFDESLNRSGSSITTLVRGTRTPLDGSVVNEVLGFSQAAGDPFNNSVWYINGVPSDDGGWIYSAGQIHN
jgi:hypothetical protein